MTDLSRIRNFAIIAHVDHGKSTLADRLIQQCGIIDKRNMKEQILDSMDIERERGITIKAQTVRLWHTARNGYTYQFNLIDTPGHVDFSYEVSRSLAACEGSLLLVDSTQGVEAQTIANAHQALEIEHKIILAINKVDLPAAEPNNVQKQVEDLIGLDTSQTLLISAKSGLGVEQLLESIVEYLPPPEGERKAPLRALLIDSWYDTYLGIVILVRVRDGTLYKGQNIRMMATNAVHRVEQIGYFSPVMTACNVLLAGEIGYITAGIRTVKSCRVGDTITDEFYRATTALPGFRQHTPVVFCGLFPIESSSYALLHDSLAKLSLNDASFVYEPETSAALGFGFRCGFLGLLHMEIIQERLAREFKIELITTAPSVIYHVHMTDGTYKELYNPSDMPDLTYIRTIEEPWILATILVPNIYLGSILTLCTERRGQNIKLNCMGLITMLVCQLPLNEVILDFYDRLKSVSHGYASLNYETAGYNSGDLVRVNILINGSLVEPLSFVAHRSIAVARGRYLCEKLKDLIPRHLFKIPIQASVGGHIVARETIPALRKDVIAKCYGGDITRKRKLLEKQKEGKKKMKKFGKVEIPQSVFIQTLRLGKNS